MIWLEPVPSVTGARCGWSVWNTPGDIRARRGYGVASRSGKGGGFADVWPDGIPERLLPPAKLA